MNPLRRRKARKAMAHAKALALTVPVTQRRLVPSPTEARAWDVWGTAR